MLNFFLFLLHYIFSKFYYILDTFFELSVVLSVFKMESTDKWNNTFNHRNKERNIRINALENKITNERRTVRQLIISLTFSIDENVMESKFTMVK